MSIFSPKIDGVNTLLNSAKMKRRSNTKALYKQVAIYSATITDHYNLIIDAGEEIATHIRIVRDVLKFCYGVESPSPRRICNILMGASKWFENAQKQVNEDRLYGFWDDDSFNDRFLEAALESGPSLPEIAEIPCNEDNIPREPYPMLGRYTFSHDPDALLEAAKDDSGHAWNMVLDKYSET